LLKFFTPEWHGGKMSDEDAERIPAAYEAYIRSLNPSLPDDALRLVHDISLHDGLLRRMRRGSGMLEVVIRAGDQQTGYFDAELTYSGAEVSPPEERFLESVVGRRDVELLYDEFDALGSVHWTHRILFWPYREVSVRFAAFALRVTTAPGRFDEGAA
jgi:hypothetical protein